MYRSIALNFWSTFLYLQSAGIAGIRHPTKFSVILGRETRVSTFNLVEACHRLDYTPRLEKGDL